MSVKKARGGMVGVLMGRRSKRRSVRPHLAVREGQTDRTGGGRAKGPMALFATSVLTLGLSSP